ncbi:prealbumin-like fold domain-containing protein [Microbacterium sp. NPDC055683]
MTLLVVVPQAPASAAANLVCSSGTSYSLRANGALQSVSSTGTITQVATPGSLTWTVGNQTKTGIDEANGLGIASDGSRAYALQRWTVGGQHRVRAMVYTASTGVWTWADGSGTAGGMTTNQSTYQVVAGAVDPATGLFMFGLFNNGRFQLYSFNPTTAAYQALGGFDTGITGSLNGDMAFDAQGNLYVVGSTTSTTIFTITSATIATAVATPSATRTLTATRLNSGDVSSRITSVNGVAFDTDGNILLSNGSTMVRYNPSTWQFLATVTTGLTSGGTSSTDLSSCATPPTLTVKKDVVARSAASDQFTLGIAAGSTSITSATTTGAANGIQAETAGPVPVTVGTRYTFSETMAPGSATPLARYASSWTCTVTTLAGSTQTLATGSGATGTLTIASSQSGLPITCTFSNSPRPTLTVHKDVVGGRAVAADQFVLTSAQGSSTLATATTSGQANGVQPQAAGPVVVTPGSTYAFREAMASGSGSALAAYASSWTCVRTDRVTGAQTTLSTGTGSSGTITVPSGIGTAAIDCTFANDARPAELTIVKDVVARVDEDDQFVLSLADAQGTEIGAATTSGSAVGEQPQRIDAVEVDPGAVYTFAETMATGSASALDQYTSAWTCTDQSGATVAEGDGATGQLTIPAGAAGQALECVIVNEPAEASLIVTKTWIVDGETFADGDQPDGLSAQLTVDAGDGPVVTPWGAETTGLVAGDVVSLDETTTIDAALAGCTVQSAIASGASIDGEQPLAVDVAIRAGQQTVAVVNTVECVSTLTILKVVESPNGGTADPSAWDLTARTGDAQPLTVDGDDEPTTANTVVVDRDVAYDLAEVDDTAAPAYEGTYVQIAIEHFTGDPDDPAALADPANWVESDGTATVARGAHEIYRFVNRDVAVPTLPLTGGAGSTPYLLAGGGIVAAGLLIGLVVVLRRRASSGE